MEELRGYGPWGLKESDMTEMTEHIYTHRGVLSWGFEEKWDMCIYIFKESLCFCVEIELYGAGGSCMEEREQLGSY